MSKDEIKYEINKVLDHFSDKALEDLLSLLKELDTNYNTEFSDSDTLSKILSEDSALLEKLAK